MTNLRVTVSGKVQGVFFRANVKKVADVLGVYGWVRNERNGSVSLEAEGPEEMVFKLVDYCHHGPDTAVVEKVSITGGVIVGYDSFEIRE
ncbi:MAG: acylphosphatase [Bacteroidetes bacterium]|nr:acylphosphatase [Bacteroidota bacterium]